MAIKRWTEAETKRALYLYFQLPFGQLHSGNTEIIALARMFGRTPSSIAMKLANFASLDPKITNSGRKGLVGATALDRQVWADFNGDWTRLIADAENFVPSELGEDNTLKEERRDFIYEPFSGEATTVAAIIEQRVGQNFFRRAVLANYDNKCCVTGIADPRLLNASHIVPWSVDKKNRHNPENGLCLSATFDRAFDRGLMAVDKSGRARFSDGLLKSESAETRSFFRPYEGTVLLEASRFNPNSEFLQWHHENCFLGYHGNV
ncbi:HNH endonuclease [Sphingomonas populi]|uniref:HNH endonuclease n=1 Tax=Sphingomonas populi TaxID=2484750 RepID=A0A4Q6XTG8_9SPHN|nr:HNH endonuclease [Sphingomonas populi]RZF63580.1 HNH endonuclease [Sphingomonas populi]